MEDTIRQAILLDGSLAALVGTRVYDLKLPSGATLPAIVYQAVSEPRLYSQSGQAARFPRIQFTCWAATATGAGALADALENALDLLARGTVLRATIENRFPLYEAETGKYKEVVEFSIIRRK